MITVENIDMIEKSPDMPFQGECNVPFWLFMGHVGLNFLSLLCLSGGIEMCRIEKLPGVEAIISGVAA